MSASFQGQMSKDEFFKYFREESRVEEGTKIESKKEVSLSLEDFATNDQKSFDNIKEIFQNSGIDKQYLDKINSERLILRKKLNMMPEEEQDEYNEDKHNKEMAEKAEEIREKGICKNFEFRTGDFLSGIDGGDSDNNIIIVDPAFQAFRGYKNKYIGSAVGDLSERIYRKFDLYDKEHRLGTVNPGTARFNINSRDLKPKIKGLIHAVGPIPSAKFMDYYRTLESTIKSISNIVRDMKNTDQIDDKTEIRIPLFSLGGESSKDMVNIYYPKIIEFIKLYFRDTTKTDECELINPVKLCIEEDDNVRLFGKYEQLLGYQEYWVYDFDGVVHDIVNTQMDSYLEKIGFDTDYTVLQTNIRKDTIKDMEKGTGFAKIKIVTGNNNKFKKSIVELLNANGIEIDEFNVITDFKPIISRIPNFGNRISALQDRIKNYNLNIYKYVDDYWTTITGIVEAKKKGYLETIHLLYYVNSNGDFTQIDLLQQESILDIQYKIQSDELQDLITGDIERETLLRNSIKLLNCYIPKFVFPYPWTVEYALQNFTTVLATANVYYDNPESGEDPMDLDLLKRLVREREPTNISGSKLYDAQKLNDFFNYSEGYYNVYARTLNGTKLPPNIAIYTETKIVCSEHDIPDQSKERVKILNSIGYAFDGVDQEDYKYFFKDKDSDGKISNDKKNILISKYENIFNKIFYCAYQRNCNKIAMSLIGTASFSGLYKPRETLSSEYGLKDSNNLAFIRDIYSLAFEKVRKEYNDKTGRSLEIVFMGTPKELYETFRQKEGKKFFTGDELKLGFTEDYEDIGYFPQNLKNVDVETTLFVNAWDMLSVPGNGNASDNSLDGYFGRFSAIGVLGTGLTNPYLQKDANFIGIDTINSLDFSKITTITSPPVKFVGKIFQTRDQLLGADYHKLSSKNNYNSDEIFESFLNVYDISKDSVVEEIQNKTIEFKNSSSAPCQLTISGTEDEIKTAIKADLESIKPFKYFSETDPGFIYWSTENELNFPYFDGVTSEQKRCKVLLIDTITEFFKIKSSNTILNNSGSQIPVRSIQYLVALKGDSELSSNSNYLPDDLGKQEENIRLLPERYFPMIYNVAQLDAAGNFTSGNHYDVWYWNNKNPVKLTVAGDGACLFRSILCYDIIKNKAQEEQKKKFKGSSVKLISWNIHKYIAKEADKIQETKIKNYIKANDPGIFFTQESVFNFEGYKNIKWKTKYSGNSINFKETIFELNGEISRVGLDDSRNKVSVSSDTDFEKIDNNDQTSRPILGVRLKHKDTGKTIVFISVWSPHFKERDQLAAYRKWIGYAIVNSGYQKTDRIIVAGDFNETYSIDEEFTKTIRFPEFSLLTDEDVYTKDDRIKLNILSNKELILRQLKPTCCEDMRVNPYKKGEDITKRNSMKYVSDLFYDTENTNLTVTGVGNSKISDHFPIIGNILIPEKPSDLYDLTKREKICNNFFTINGGILAGDPTKENNWVIIDPGGEAFKKDKGNYQGVTGGSKQIYDTYGLSTKTHSIVLNNGEAIISQEDFSGKIKAMIHAVGPDASQPGMNEPKFTTLLKTCIENIKTQITALKDGNKLDQDTEIRIPLISGATYGGDIVKNNYDRYLTTFVNFIRSELCPIGYQLVLGLYTADEQTKFETFYASYSPPKTGLRSYLPVFSSPKKIDHPKILPDYKYISPTSKVKNSRSRKKRKIKNIVSK